MTKTTTTERALTTAEVTKAPKLRPAKTEDGVHTGMWVTLHASVALSDHGPIAVPTGTLITSPISGGIDGRLSSMCERRKIGTNGATIVYRF